MIAEQLNGATASQTPVSRVLNQRVHSRVIAQTGEELEALLSELSLASIDEMSLMRDLVYEGFYWSSVF